MTTLKPKFHIYSIPYISASLQVHSNIEKMSNFVIELFIIINIVLVLFK